MIGDPAGQIMTYPRVVEGLRMGGAEGILGADKI